MEVDPEGRLSPMADIESGDASKRTTSPPLNLRRRSTRTKAAAAKHALSDGEVPFPTRRTKPTGPTGKTRTYKPTLRRQAEVDSTLVDRPAKKSRTESPSLVIPIGGLHLKAADMSQLGNTPDTAIVLDKINVCTLSVSVHYNAHTTLGHKRDATQSLPSQSSRELRPSKSKPKVRVSQHASQCFELIAMTLLLDAPSRHERG